MAQDCPACGVTNPSETQRCDCGYDFIARGLLRPHLTNAQPRQAARGSSPSRQSRSVRSLWRGDVPLRVTYWLYGVSGAFLLSLPFIFVEAYPPQFPVEIALFVYSLPVLGYSVFVVVAIWRAATKYQGSVWWARLAKLSVFVGVLRGVSEIGRAVEEVVRTVR